MPRKRRDEEIVLSLLKQFAHHKDCPWSHRVYCVYVLAVITKMIPESMIPPGVNRYRPRDVGVPAFATEEPKQDDSSYPMDMGDFVKQLSGGADVRKT